MIGDDRQHRAADLPEVLREIHAPHERHEAREPRGARLRRLVEEPFDEPRIDAGQVEPVRDRVGQEAAEPAPLDVREPLAGIDVRGTESRRRRKVRQRLDALGIIDRDLHRDDGAGGRAGQVDAIGAEVWEQLHDVESQAIQCQRQRGGRHLGRAVAARVEAHDAEVASQPRDPRVQPARASHRRVQQHQRVGAAPRIAEVVDHVGETHAVTRREVQHRGLLVRNLRDLVAAREEPSTLTRSGRAA